MLVRNSHVTSRRDVGITARKPARSKIPQAARHPHPRAARPTARVLPRHPRVYRPPAQAARMPLSIWTSAWSR